MRLKRLHIRYYPPGIFLDYEKGGQLRTKSIDLLNLTPETDVNELVSDIRAAEPLISSSCVEQLKALICKLQEKVSQKDDRKFYLFRALQAHILPLTNVAFNKSGSSFITGSYDRTCKIWDTASGEELHTLEGHRNVVYAIAFNNPYGDKVATGSFDKTCKLWSAETGKCFYTFRGHTAEIVCLAFNPQSTLVATGSMDTLAKLWDVESGKEMSTLALNSSIPNTNRCVMQPSLIRSCVDVRNVPWVGGRGEETERLEGHFAEIISLSFNTTGDRLVTGSFDHTAILWDVSTGSKVHVLTGHRGEISCVQFNWDCSLIVTASLDKTCKVWAADGGQCLATLLGHNDEVLDVCFNYTGQLIATASADGTSRVFSAETFQCLWQLEGHKGEISKALISCRGPFLFISLLPPSQHPACHSSSSLHINTAVCILIALFISSFLRPILTPSCHNILSFLFYPPPDRHHH
ncbi:dynein assembly factor with WDR repeat domains 1 isoform X1 [Carassius carassius]|uniref:dynein assembly factor with WDR repeat domains 1 isoform X1 n=1 Tax=Carassius carassius TaxID=217509 RepID=UPI00286926D0|nr:dynein assembly factor with WDR repeat domains 1 isoform X1 [Carassius carassius]